MKRIAIFPGSFDPYTIGHHSIIERALPLFDKIIIAIGINGAKNSMFTPQQRIDSIRQLYASEPRIEVASYSGLTVEYAKTQNANFILRGVRMIQDFEYEKNLAEVNRSLTGIETVLLYTLPEHSHISSSIVRELLSFNHDVSNLLPKGLIL
ncbi:MAG: pantetheine-phosphate adenylyltransferase [Muribaculaceae bacterium]|nr:pantetheine-phosphate adenylyltransferase [Muribaculaceae bacterium]